MAPWGSVDRELITIPAGRVLLRPFLAEEVDAEWDAMLHADELTLGGPPDEARFRARLARSGQMVDGWLDLAIDVNGIASGRIQTFVPADRREDPTTYNIGILLRPAARGRGYGAEALDAFTRWLREHAGARRVEGRTDPRNHPMQRVFAKLGWDEEGVVPDGGREWLLFVAPQPSGRSGPRG